MTVMPVTTRSLTTYATAENRWAVIDWISESTGIDFLTLWSNIRTAPNFDTTNVQNFLLLDAEDHLSNLLFGEERDVWTYGRSHRIGENRYIEVCADILDQICGAWNIEISWGDAAPDLPASQEQLVAWFYGAYGQTIISEGGSDWALFNGLHYTRGTASGVTGLSMIIERLRPVMLALRILRNLAERWIAMRTLQLQDGGANAAAAAAAARAPFVEFLKMMDASGTDNFEGAIIRMMHRRAPTSDAMDSEAAQGALCLLNGHFYHDGERLMWSMRRGPELAAMRNSRVAQIYWPGPEGEVTVEDLERMWRGTRIEQFLAETIPHEDHKVRLAFAVGDSLFGKQRAKIVAMMIGPKDSGKTILLELIGEILGTYADALPEDLMMTKKYGGDKFAMEPVRGKRFGMLAEAEESQTLNGVALKRLTGRDTTSSRGLRQSHVSFKPEITLFIGTNDEPAAMVNDVALTDRLLRIYTGLAAGVVKDPDIRDKMRAHDVRLAAFAWALWGSISPVCGAALREFMVTGTAAESVESAMGGGDTRISAMVECLRAGILRAVGQPEEWYDWRKAPGIRNPDKAIEAGRAEVLGDSVGRGAADWLAEQHLLNKRSKGELGAPIDEVIMRLQAFVDDPGNRAKFQRSPDKVLWGSNRALRKLLSQYFGGARRGAAGVMLMGIEIPTVGGKTRF